MTVAKLAGTSPALTCAVTRLRPGERATGPSPAAIRIVLEGDARFTPRDGEAVTVTRGDVVRARAGEWRAGGSGVLWFDAGDQHGPAGCRSRSSCPSRTRGACPRLRPVHRWAQTEAVLAQAVAGGSFPAIARLGAPRPAGDVTAALRVEAHRLRPGGRTASTRTSASAAAVVLAGTGTSVVGGRRLCWGAGDVFAVPSGAPVDHQADVMSDLFLVSDAPAMRALGLLWSQTDPQHQSIEPTLA